MIPSDEANDLYLNYLINLVGADSHRSLMSKLYKTEFDWFVPNDDNRATDGLALRKEFIFEEEVLPFGEWTVRPCSILEMIIGVARRLSYDTDIVESVWFWEMLDNLNLVQYKDAYYDRSVERHVTSALKTLNDRTYKRTGLGGLFPMKSNKDDQRKIEIWYQMSAYLLENNYLDY